MTNKGGTSANFFTCAQQKTCIAVAQAAIKKGPYFAPTRCFFTPTYMHNYSSKTLYNLPGSRLHNPVQVHTHTPTHLHTYKQYIPVGADVVASAPALPLHMQVDLRSQDLPVPFLELKYHSPSSSLISVKQPKGRPPECSCLNLPAFRTFPDLDKSLHWSLLIGDKPMPSQVLLVVVT